MLDKLFKKKQAKPEANEETTKADGQSSDEKEDMLDETGTFMLDINKLKDTEDLEDLLNDV